MALVEANRDWLGPHFLHAGDTWSLNFRSWIMQVDDMVVVIDPCTGNGKANPMPVFNMLDVPFIERFCETGFRPEDVDCVFCTHMHHDHCGWNTHLKNGRWVPTFPNAKYIVVQREYDRWQGADRAPSATYATGVFEESIQPVVEAGLAELVLDRHRISPSLEVEPAYGHTIGHSMLRLTSGGEEAFFTGDSFHHPLQIVKPDLHFGRPEAPALALETRQRIQAQALERDALIIPAHIPAPHAGRLRRQQSRIVFEALASAHA
jgi:glyoxylase-like metal-dependent hydrolase (beta-lactamase superfamily II)